MNEYWVRYNCHPKDLNVRDCIVRAVATALNEDYLEVRKELNHTKKELGYSSYKDKMFLYDYLKDYPRILFKSEKGKPRCKVTDFCNTHLKGTYILSLRGHATCCVNGKVYDTWDCTYLTVYTAWKISDEGVKIRYEL